MLKASGKFITAGTRVKVREAMSVPQDSAWDDDNQRTSTPVKKRLQSLFFNADRRVQAEVVYVTSETVRERLRRKNQVKVQVRDAAGSVIVITASVDHIKAVA